MKLSYLNVAFVLLLSLWLCECEPHGELLALMSEDDSKSIEIPVRRPQRSGQSQHRPIVELVLGVLDTFHSSSKSDLRRIKARRARQNEAYAANATEPSRKLATPRKRIIAPPRTLTKNAN